MAHQVQVNRDGVVLPDGNEYNTGDSPTITDAQFAEISQAMLDGDVITDLGGAPDGGATNLGQLTDVDLSGLANGDTLVWSADEGKFVAGVAGPAITNGSDHLMATYGGAGINVASSSDSTFPYTSVIYDAHTDGTAVTLAVNNKDIVMHQPGLYWFVSRVQWSFDASGARRLAIVPATLAGLTDTTLLTAPGRTSEMPASSLPPSRWQFAEAMIPCFAANATVQLQVNQDSGNPLQVLSAKLYVVRVL